MIIIGIVFALIGCLLIISVILRQAKCKIKVEATVSKVEAKTVPLRGTTIKQYTPVLTYTLNGGDHTTKADLLTDKKEKFSVGQKLTVFVDPENPETIRYGRNSGFLFCGIAFVLIGGLIIMLALVQ